MQARAAISRKLSDSIKAGALTIKDLCESLGINAHGRDASLLWDEIITRYLALAR